MKIIQKGLILQFGTILVIFIFQTLLYFFVKRDLKGFKCMTVSLDVFRDFLCGNTVWPQASAFQKLAKMDHFWHF